MRYIIPISGKDSLATAIVQTLREPDKDYEFVFNPTNAELPELSDWLNRVEKHFNKKIVRIGKDLITIIEDYNWFLPSPMARYCTKESKIFPFIGWIGKDDCFVYYGIRADEQREGFNNVICPNIIPKYPLIDLGIDLKNVYTILNNFKLKPPMFFWQSIFNEVCSIVGDVTKLLEEWEIDILFAWRSRANCYFCFNQRLYEIVGLLEHHPELFDEMERMENKAQTRKKEYSWKQNWPLSRIREKCNEIKRKRIDFIVNVIGKKKREKIIARFFDVQDDDDTLDILSVKSCGLFCGK